LQEFKALAQQSASYNTIVDFLPLHEIILIDFELKAKDSHAVKASSGDKAGDKAPEAGGAAKTIIPPFDPGI
jgi:hypothetical protein